MAHANIAISKKITSNKKMKIILQRTDDAFQFEAKNEEGYAVNFDLNKDDGGNGRGIRPMQSLLMALGMCSAVDIVIILKKQKQKIVDFKIEVSGEREKGGIISLWKDVHVIYYLSGNIDTDKAKRSISLSLEKYCSVAATLRLAGAKITYAIHLNGLIVN